MRLFRTVRVSDHQRVIWFRDGNLQGVLTPGVYRFFRYLARTEFYSFDVTESMVDLPNPEFLVRAGTEKLREHIELRLLQGDEVALVFADNMAVRLVAPGQALAYWRDFKEVSIESINFADDVRVPQRWMKAIELAGPSFREELRDLIEFVFVEEGFQAIVMIDGEVDRVLRPGRYAFWKIGREVKVTKVDGRLQVFDLSGQEILTKDRTSLRLNVSLAYRISDVVKATMDTPDVNVAAYRVMQLAVRRVVGALTLDQLLEEKNQINQQIEDLVSAELQSLGVTLDSVGIKDVILPGEMRAILNQVVEAEKLAEVSAIRRRDETQDVRALANTARQLSANPMMARLKELEALESVSSNVDSLNVYHGLDGVMDQLIQLKG